MEWISVETELPKRGMQVWIIYNGRLKMDRRIWWHKTRTDVWEDSMESYVTVWCYPVRPALPEPPKE